MTTGRRLAVDAVGRGRWRISSRTAFLAVLLVVIAAYTQMAFDLEWRSAAGRIGPGFFPRIVGGLAAVLTLVALALSVGADAADTKGQRADEDPAGEESGGHLRSMLAMVAASFALMAVYTILGAIIACALFLAATLFFFNRGHALLNIVLSIALPLAVYLLFQSLLNAGLPDGILPRF